jgi:pyridoxine 5'-phosphate synthase PdxJ
MLHVLAAASEIFPLVKTGGLADVVGALPAALRPHGVAVRTLVPGYPAMLAALENRTAVHKFADMFGGRENVRKVVKTLRDADIKVSLFIDPDLDQVKAAHRAEAATVEFHTGRYCDARLASDRRRELSRLVDACKAASKLGLEVAAGHGLNYQNVLPVAAIPEIEELNIGHSIVGRAVLVGMERAVREMRELIAKARP